MRQARTWWLIAGLLSLFAVPAADAATLRLDGRFGEGGVARVRFKLRYSAVDLRPLRAVRQPDGKVLVAASAYFDHGNSQILIARFTRRGRPDATFGHRGWAHVGLSWNFAPTDVQVQPDGRILVFGGAGYAPGWYPSPGQFGVARLLPNGTLDRSFGNEGFVTWNPPWHGGTVLMTAVPGGLVQQGDGRLLAGGMVDELRDLEPNNASKRVSLRRVAFVRLDSDGSVDRSFGNGGVTEGPDEPGTTWFHAWAALPDGELVTLASRNEGTVSWWVHRFTPDGAPDHGFGQDGSARLGVNEALDDYSLQLVAANDGSLVVMANDQLNSRAVPIRRILADGRLDPSFGTACERAPRVHLLGGAASSDGGILATARVSVRHARNFVLRYGPNGCPAGRPLRLGAVDLAGPPLLQGRRAALVSGATDEHELTLSRIRR